MGSLAKYPLSGHSGKVLRENPTRVRKNKIAKSMDIKYVLLIDEAGKIHISQAMHERVKFKQQRDIVELVQL